MGKCTFLWPHAPLGAVRTDNEVHIFVLGRQENLLREKHAITIQYGGIKNLVKQATVKKES